MDLKFLGVGAAFNTEQKNTSAFVKEKNSIILVDCGCTVFSQIQKLDLLKEVNNVYVFITHFHPDHIGSLGDLIFYTHFVKSYNIQVFCPDKDIIRLLRLQGLKEGIHYEYTNVSLEANAPTTISDSNFFYKVFAIKTEHDDNINNYGYCFEEYDKKIVFNEAIYSSVDKVYYSGDSAAINSFVYNNVNSLKKIYHDVSSNGGVHASLDSFVATIPKEIRNKFYLMHYTNKELMDKIKENGFNTVEIFSKGE